MLSSSIKGKKRQKKKGQCSGLGCRDWNCDFSRERVSHFSLDFWLIRPSEFFGARSKVALRGEAYAWAMVLRSFDKLCEVGDLFYLVLHFV